MNENGYDDSRLVFGTGRIFFPGISWEISGRGISSGIPSRRQLPNTRQKKLPTKIIQQIRHLVCWPQLQSFPHSPPKPWRKRCMMIWACWSSTGIWESNKRGFWKMLNFFLYKKKIILHCWARPISSHPLLEHSHYRQHHTIVRDQLFGPPRRLPWMLYMWKKYVGTI